MEGYNHKLFQKHEVVNKCTLGKKKKNTREQVFKNDQTKNVWGDKHVPFSLNAEKLKRTGQTQWDLGTTCHLSSNTCNKKQIICT